METSLDIYSEIWIVDFEYSTDSNFRPVVICMIAVEIKTQRILKLYGGGLLKEPSFLGDNNALYVCYFGVAEMGCHLQLGWRLPNRLLDLYTEFRVVTNGQTLHCGKGLLGALAYFGLKTIGTDEKTDMRNLAIRGGPFSDIELSALLDYCESDVRATELLFHKMWPLLSCVSHSLYRGEYMKCVARIENVGIPLDSNFLNRLKNNFDSIKAALIEKIDINYCVFYQGTFKQNLFENYLVAHNISWPRLESSKLRLDDDTFKLMSTAHPELNDLRELRTTLSQTKLNKINIGSDGRNRVMLSPFSSLTGRNQPSTSKFIYGPSAWIRFAIKPNEGMAIAYIDWSQQEFGIAAALSRDPNMLDAYLSGDPYLEFAKLAGAVPQDGTKKSHPAERENYKACVLAVQYGMGEESLSIRINKPVSYAKELIEKHKLVFKVFWNWSDDCLNYAYLKGYLTTTLGWKYRLNSEPNPRSLRNFPMQANGAEILRFAIILATEKGIKINAPIHDALLIEAPIDQIEECVRLTQVCMKNASAFILNGFKLRSDVEIYRSPDRYQDKRGEKMWQTVNQLLDDVSPMSP